MQKTDNLYNVYLDNATTILVDENDIFNFKIYKDNYLSEENIAYLNDKNSYYHCLNDAVNLMNAKFYASKQLSTKLESKGYNKYDIERVVSYLDSINLVDDNAFYDSYVVSKVSQGYGPMYIKHKLYELGINEDVYIAYEQQYDMLKNKYMKLPFNKYSKSVINKKFKDKMIKQGFNIEIIQEVINNIDVEENSDAIKVDYKKLYNKYQNKYDSIKLQFTIKQKLMQKGYTSIEIEQVMKEGKL